MNLVHAFLKVANFMYYFLLEEDLFLYLNKLDFLLRKDALRFGSDWPSGSVEENVRYLQR